MHVVGVARSSDPGSYLRRLPGAGLHLCWDAVGRWGSRHIVPRLIYSQIVFVSLFCRMLLAGASKI